MALKVGQAARERIDHLRRLLDLEESEARARDEAMWADTRPRALEQQGVLARGLVRLDETPALLGKVRWLLGEDPARHGHLAGFDVRPGAVIALPSSEDEPPARGVVVRVERTRLTVIFDEPPDVDRDARIDLYAVSDTVTLGRLRQGLDACGRVEGPSARLVEVLLGVRPPEPIPEGALEPIDDSLNDDQLEALRRAVLTEDVALVHGPFGTGKTTVLVEVVRQCLARGERILCLAASNAAADHLAISILERSPNAPLTRAGHPARAHPRLEAHTLSAKVEDSPRHGVARRVLLEALGKLRQAERRSSRGAGGGRERRDARNEARALFAEARRLERDASREVLEKTRVLVGTLTGYQHELPGELRFDRLVVDEASQALTPAVLLGALRADRAVLAGDHRQLTPTVLSRRAVEQGLAHTVFEGLMDGPYGRDIGHMLTVQHRMHVGLMQFPSEQFYGGRLEAHPAVAGRTLRDLGIGEDEMTLPDRPLDVIDTAGAGLDEETESEGSSKENSGQAAIVARMVEALIARGLAPSEIGVITPYSAQVARLNGLLSRWADQGLEIDTVDGFQGREKEAIVFDAVRSNALAEIGFLADQRRLNVAVTRAKRKLVMVADSATVASDRVWGALFDAAARAGAHRSCFELPGYAEGVEPEPQGGEEDGS